MDSRFTIYSASAGSGKTFNLALEYIALCIRGHEYTFREILAITFTNKAADEMKSRILNYLHKLSINDTSENFLPFREALSQKTGLSPAQLSEKAKKILFAILHDFSAFYVTTIDSFFVHLFRSFSVDLHISHSKKPSIDQQLIQDLALDDIVSSLGIVGDFTDFFRDYLRKQLADPNESDTNPVSKLKNLIKKVSKDASYTLLQALKDTSYEEFKTKIENLRTIKSELFDSIFNTNEQIKNIFLQNQIRREYCSRGTLYDLFFVKLTDQPINVSQTLTTLENVLNKQWQENFNKKALETVFSIAKIELDVIELSSQIHNNLLKIQFIDNILNLSSLLIILRDAENSIKKLSDEENLILLSDISRIINDQIRQETGDFIYEKIGNRFKHIFIDEFQDTSKRQWENMHPLITNALATDGSVKLIGDPKQSIYRFRNADSKQMLDLIHNAFSEKYPISPHSISLHHNFRSAKSIVHFNNKIFNFICLKYKDTPYIYKSFYDVIQQEHVDKEGYVEIKYIPQEEYDERTIDYVASVIKNKVQDGYNLSDIAILVRSNEHGKKLTNALVNQTLNDNRRIEITSSDSFLLKENTAVNILIYSLRVIEHKDNQTASFELLYLLLKEGFLQEITSEHSVLFEYANFGGDVFGFLERNNFQLRTDSSSVFGNRHQLRKLSVDELTMYFVKLYGFNREKDAFISAFIDLVYDFCQNTNRSDIGSFLYHWDNIIGDTYSINTGAGIDAVQIITIHKAKGLEWPVVILPFFDFKTFKSEEELILLDENQYILKNALIQIKKSEHWPDEYEQSRVDFIDRQLADNINLMYVAFTRARDEMYISLKNKPSVDDISFILLEAISENFETDSSVELFSLGAASSPKSKPMKVTETTPKYVESMDWRNALKIAPVYSNVHSDKLAQGSRIHALISSCYKWSDFQEKLERISPSDPIRAMFRNLTQTISESDELKSFYSSERIFNERKILFGGHYYVPDSMAINDNKISILEYKTGNKNPKHIHQLKNYMQLAREAGYAIDSAYLIYINNEKVEFEKILLH